MKVELTKWDIKRIRLALFLAAEWEESCIESFLVNGKEIIKNKNGQDFLVGYEKVVPKVWKKEVDRLKLNIKRFKELSEKLK